MTNFFKYLNITAAEERWGLYVTTVGYSKIDPNEHYPNNDAHPTNHSFNWNNGRILNAYYLVFISRGRGVFESAKTSAAAIDAGTSFFLYPGVWHRYKPEIHSGWEEYWVGFNGSYATALMNEGFFSADNPFIKVGLRVEFLNLFQHLLDTVRKSDAGYPQVIAGIALQILGIAHSVSLAGFQDDQTQDALISKAKFLIQESLEKPLDMEQLAKELPMGYSNFRKAFKKSTGESPNQYHLHLRMNKAIALLTTTHLNIKEIAFHTGFDSVFYFSKLFKKKMGKSPKAYRSATTGLD